MKRSGAAGVRELVLSHPEAAVLARLRAVYRREIVKASADPGELLPRCRADEQTFDRVSANSRFVGICARAESASVVALEVLLEALLRHRQQLAAPAVRSGTP